MIKSLSFQQNGYNSQSHYSVPGIFYPPPFGARYFQEDVRPGNGIPPSQDASSTENKQSQNDQCDSNAKQNQDQNQPFLIMDDEQQYESASIIYGPPGMSWTASPSPLHQATQAAIQYPPFVEYYPDYQNGSKYIC